MTLVFADGSDKNLRMVADNPKPEEIQQLAVEPDVLRIDLGEGRSRRPVPERRALLVLGKNSSEHVQVESDSRWLKANLVKLEGKRGELKITVEVNQLAGCIFPVTGELSLRTRPTETPVKLRVVVSSPRGYTVDPPVLELSTAKSGTVAIKPIAGQSWTSGSASPETAVVSGPEGISIEGVKEKDGAVLLQVRCNSATPRGYHVVTCRIGPQTAALDVQMAVRVE